jgi:putative membrane protein insertion efficiency factor
MTRVLSEAAQHKANSLQTTLPAPQGSPKAQLAAPQVPPPQVVTRVLLALLAFYRRWISPAIHSLSPGHGCKFLPTCSEYASVAIATHGPLRGTALAVWRLLRCHPFTRGGLDPVPPASISRHIPHKPLP